MPLSASKDTVSGFVLLMIFFFFFIFIFVLEFFLIESAGSQSHTSGVRLTWGLSFGWLTSSLASCRTMAFLGDVFTHLDSDIQGQTGRQADRRR